jgi:hypothetical protein
MISGSIEFEDVADRLSARPPGPSVEDRQRIDPNNREFSPARTIPTSGEGNYKV